MISAFAAHLVSRYGIEEVARGSSRSGMSPTWTFWGGEPKQTTRISSSMITPRGR